MVLGVALLMPVGMGRDVSNFSNNVLSPQTSINQLARVEPFHVSVEKAIQSGFFNEIFETGEKLEFVEATPVGDPHVYFTIHDIHFDPTTATVRVSYLVKDEEGYGIPTFHNLEISRASYGDYSGESLDSYPPVLQSLYHKVDLALRKLLYRNGSWQNLFENSTKLVILKSQSTGQQYKVYYKFGQSSQMEFLGEKILKKLGVKTPKIHQSADRNYVWIENIESNYSSPHLDFEEVQWEMPKPELEELFFDIGRYITFLFLLGHDDFHPGNFLVTPKSEGYAIDFETIGQANFFQLYGQSTYSEFNRKLKSFLSMPKKMDRDVARRLYQGMEGFEDTNFRLFDPKRVDPTVVEKLFQGIEDAAKIARTVLPTLYEALEETGLNHIYTRRVILPTTTYVNARISPIPHYSIKISREELARIIKKRYSMLYEFLKDHKLVPNYTSNFGGSHLWNRIDANSGHVMDSSL